jgi:hypothetical protein
VFFTLFTLSTYGTVVSNCFLDTYRIAHVRISPVLKDHFSLFVTCLKRSKNSGENIRSASEFFIAGIPFIKDPGLSFLHFRKKSGLLRQVTKKSGLLRQVTKKSGLLRQVTNKEKWSFKTGDSPVLKDYFSLYCLSPLTL